MLMAASRDHRLPVGDAVVRARSPRRPRCSSAPTIRAGNPAATRMSLSASTMMSWAMPRAHVDEVRHLRLEPCRRPSMTSSTVLCGKVSRSCSTTATAGSSGCCDAEHDLHGPGIILSAEREQILGQPRLVAVQGLQDRDGRMLAGGFRRPPREAADEDRRRAEIKAPGRRDDEAGEGEPGRHDRPVRCRPPPRSACANAPRGPPVRPSSARRRTPSGAPPAC